MNRTERPANPFGLQMSQKYAAARTTRVMLDSESREDFHKLQGFLVSEKHLASQPKVQSEKHSISSASPFPCQDRGKDKDRDSTLSDITHIIKNNSSGAS